MRICLTAIWPSFAHFKNTIPASQGLTSSDMLCFFLFVRCILWSCLGPELTIRTLVLQWLFQFPLILIHPRRLRTIFLMKAVTLPIVAIGMMGWTIHQAGDRASEVMRTPSTLKGLNGFCTSAILPRRQTSHG